MSHFNFKDLTPMQRGRVDKCLKKLFRWEIEGEKEVLSLGERIEGLGSLTKYASTNEWKYNRVKFNRMDYPEQEAYEARLKKGRTYSILYDDGHITDVPKVVFDALNVKDTTNYDKLGQ